MSQFDEDNKKNGVFYTPNILAQYVADKLIKYYLNSSKLQDSSTDACSTVVSIIDPACGEGELLVAAMKSLSNEVSISPRVSSSYGVDTDANAIRKTRQRVEILNNGYPSSGTFHGLVKNALFPYIRKHRRSAWQTIKQRLDNPEGFDLLIANPPWGADTTSYGESLSPQEYSLFKGQFDTSDLFVELALDIVRPSGFFAFIVPDSLFSRERIPLRRMLLENTRVKFIARLGEKIFPNTNRACAVIICQNEKPDESTVVDCLRLSPALRKQIIKRQSTFKEAELNLVHQVHQKRFVENDDYVFDIFVRTAEENTIRILHSSKTSFRTYLTSSRGVELSKLGRICKCSECEKWMPYPVSHYPKCLHCMSKINPNSLKSTRIITQEQKPDAKKIIVGEDIERYLLHYDHWITPDKNGINYKEMLLYQGPKIVVRKTGVGILASIDYNDALTNQVVYILKQKAEHKTIPLEFFLAILNSRAMYYFLVKVSGETEWRSHPYLTQNQILDFPFPDIDLAEAEGRQLVSQIKHLVSPILLDNKILPRETDAEVERIVATMYGLTKDHYKHIYDTLSEVEQLLPIKALNAISIDDIFSS